MKTVDKESFFERVYEITRQIPCGKVTTYGIIAKCIGAPQSSRMVGWALNKTVDIIPYIPAHRVVNRNGLLTGKNHFQNDMHMQKLLEEEGIVVKNNKIVDFQSVLWNPFLNY